MINAWLVGDKEVAARLQALPDNVRSGLESAVTGLALMLIRAVQSQKLSGQVLKVRTGTLRRSITHKIDSGESSVTATVGTNVAYAARHEYGFTGTESVRAHLRTIKQAFGRSIKSGSKQVSVRAHARQVKYPARSFLRSALSEMRHVIRADLQKALENGARKAMRA